MTRKFCGTLILATTILTIAAVHERAAASPPVAPTNALPPEQERAKFKLPPGLEIQLVAADPDIHKPMNIAFDARGRLWVTDTVEYPWPVLDARKPRDTVKVLSDFDEAGRARKIVTFADGLNIPLGVLPLNAPDGRDAAIVYSIPEIRRLADADGDGVADRRDLLLGTFASADTHGMTNNFVRGFDGWVYANHGFKNISRVTASDGSSIRMSSGNTYRFRADGSRVEFHARGQVNPFGLCFDPLGNLYSADCHSRPQYLLLRGACYPSFGTPHDGLGFGPEMCAHDHGSTAIAGTLYYAADAFPAAFRDNLFNGNPVTNAVNRDRIEWHGSSPKAVEQPDFLTCDDPWFRPVQVVLGPDGAMYIADFYNKIIGHYEVDLKHPGRDRTSGRIWRVVYKGDAQAAAPPPRLPDLTKASPAELIAAMGDANLTVRMLATHVWGDGAANFDVQLLRDALRTSSNPRQKVHLLWALFRRPGIVGDDLRRLAKDADASVRVHVMRVLSEMTTWGGDDRAMAVAGLGDADPFVRRAAADALLPHPDAQNARPLLDLKGRTPAEDTHLLQTIKIALREQLVPPGSLAKLPLAEWSESDRNAVAEAVAGVPTSDAGSFLVKHLQTANVDRSAAETILRHVARYAPAEDLDALAGLVTAKFGDDVELQLDLFKSVREGLQQRGAPAGPALTVWGKSLVSRVLTNAETQPGGVGWTSFKPDGKSSAGGVWPVKALPSSDGRTGEPFFTSLPRGEAFTGLLRTGPFALPERLSFYVAGQSGAPPQTDPPRSSVRLRAEGTDEVLLEVPIPRNDVAQKVTWDLKPFAGRRGYVEAADPDNRNLWAWIAVGRLDPPVATVPAAKADTFKKRQESAIEIAGAMKLAEFQEPLRKLLAGGSPESTVRVAAAKALASIDPAAAAAPLALVVADRSAPVSVRDAAALALGGANSDAARAALVIALGTAPEAGQKAVALALAASPAGADALLTACAQGKASPRLLQEKPVRDRLAASNPDKLEERLATLTKGLISADEATQKLIDQRRAAFDLAKALASPERGILVFQKNCAACHRIGNDGAQVGPQLDGIGKRGHERIIEDLLDPSRNVDAAFRVSVLTLADGDVQSGLLRREEGVTLVFADAQGKEFGIPKANVTKRTESQMSLMPGNFGDVISPAEFNDLLAFLVGK